MGTVIVKSIAEMNRENRRFISRVRKAQVNMIRRGGEVNKKVSRSMITTPLARDRKGAPIKHTGTLLSLMELNRINMTTYRFTSSAPHSIAIEKGIVPKGQGNERTRRFSGNWISFAENPKLREWVLTKLNLYDQDKAAFFMEVGAVKVGTHGFPYTFPNGVHYMEEGFNIAVSNLKSVIILDELNKLN